ncbi:MAG TPA: LPS export ABC transporter periplasmic protein LptC [Vicinamibacterales bacterium]
MRKNARLIIAVFGVVFAVFVALQFKRRGPVGPATAITPPASGAVVETTGGQTQRFDSSREHVRVKYDKLLTYSNGASKLVGVTVTTEDRSDNGRSFVITGREGSVESGETKIVLDGDVRLQSSDGLTARTEHATYTSSDGNVAAPGPVEVSKARLSASGKGLTYDKGRDVLTILEHAIVKVAPEGAASAGEGADGKGGGVDVSSGTAAFARRDKLIQFNQQVRIVRTGGQTIEADAAIARLSQDEQRIESLELHNHARITGTSGGAGSLRGMSGADMTLNYAPDGQSLQHALVVGEASVQLAGEGSAPGRQIAAQTLDITMGPDGTTPIGLQGRDAVQLTFPPEPGTPGRTIRAAQIDARGEPGRGITRATFTGGVQFRERGGQIDRAASSAQLEVAMKPGMAAIDEARFLHNVRFEQGQLAAFAAAARYDTVKGSLELTGSEPGQLTPRTINERIAVDATRIDVVLEGPQVKAAGSVKSTLQPAKAGTDSSDTKLPSMLKQDQPVTVVADNLLYDGAASLATYTGNAKLFQVDTTIKGDSMVIDEKKGDLSASGHTMTSTLREQEDKDKKKTKTQSTGTSDDLKYEDGPRRMTYTGSAHLVGPEGDMSAQKIELYLAPGGDDVERAEGYAAPNDKLTLREVTRTTTGARMTYTAEKETYVVTGAPATLIDECGRETIGKTLTFVKSADTIVADGNQQIRTQTKGGSGKCP